MFAVPISRGLIDGSTITFECTSGDLQRSISFTGRISGDQLALTWAKRVREGGPPNAYEPVFGASAPPQYIAKRAPDIVDAVAELADRAPRFRPVTFDRILNAAREPQNWLTYSGNLLGERHSSLTQITPANVRSLEPAWIWQAQSNAGLHAATSLVLDGVLYTVQGPNTVVALDADTGWVRWTYSYQPGPDALTGYGRINRGLAILGDLLFMGTLDAHVVAISTYTGKLVWDVAVADASPCSGCYGITGAPLVVKDKVIVGLGSGDQPTRGAIAAFDAASGKPAWRFNTVPAPGEPGNDTWSGESWRTGGVGAWNTGSYDADLNLIYWGTGNPYPFDPDARLGDNLYSNSVVALDADTGTLKWHYQFTPHDVWDWDSTQIPVLTDLHWQGRTRKVMLWANRNGLMYVLDRTTGQLLLGRPFVEVNWMSGFDEKGRPVLVPERGAKSDSALIRPAAYVGATVWQPPSYSPNTGLFYVPAWDMAPVGNATPANAGYGALRAFDPLTGERKWEFKKDKSDRQGYGERSLQFAGVLTTASDLLFAGVGDGYFYALNAITGQVLWQAPVAGKVWSGPMSYAVNGKQYIAVAAGNILYAFAVRP
jgi:alcohol dehydrogenase (cytochrome c)